MNRVRIAAVLTPVVALAAAGTAQGAAPGWHTPKAASKTTIKTYAAGAGGQAVELFGNGSAATRTAQIRAIKTDGSEGTAVGISVGQPGFNFPALDLDDEGRVVAAWTIDTATAAPSGLAVAMGRRTALPRAGTVLPTDGQDVTGLSVALADDGSATLAWIQVQAATATVKAAWLRAGQPPVVAVVAQRSGAALSNVNLGIDGGGKAIVTWNVTPPTGASSIGRANGNGAGGYAPATEQPLAAAPILNLQSFVQEDGTLLTIWSEGDQVRQTVKASSAAPGAVLGAARTVISGQVEQYQPVFASNVEGRAVVVYPQKSGNGTTLRVVLRTASGAWGSARTLGGTGRSINQLSAGVDADGRVVTLWDDRAATNSSGIRILSARSRSATSALGSPSQVRQRSGDSQCNRPLMWLASSGDGLGWWSCAASPGASASAPRTARLTAP
jgi:hypothetical protein